MRVATRQSVGCKLQETLDNEGTAAGKRKSLMASERRHWIWTSDQRGNGSHKRTEWVCLRLCFARRGVAGNDGDFGLWLLGAAVAAAPSGIASRSPNPNEVVSSDTDSRPRRARARERGGECIRFLTLIV